MTYATPGKCRVCGSADLTPLFSLGDQLVSDFVDADEVHAGVRCPVELELCGGCTLVQQRHTAPQDFLYSRHYWYQSGTTQTMRDALADVAAAAGGLVGLKKNDVVIDIGSNDGTLLRSYADPPGSRFTQGLIRVGVDPATNFGDEALDGLDLFVNDFWGWEAYARNWGEVFGTEPKKAKVVTAVGMLYDLEDPSAFIADVAKVLAPDGVFVAQLMCLKQTVALGDVGNFCLPGGSTVLTDGHLCDIDSLQVGDLVLTHKGRYRAVRQVFSRRYTGDIVELRAYGFGHTLRVTPEHPVMVERDGAWRWVAAQDVRVGDVVGRPVVSETRDILEEEVAFRPNGRGPVQSVVVPFNDDLMRVMGWYLAEGHVGHSNLCFYFGTSEEEQALAARCRDAVIRLGFSANIRHNRTSCSVEAAYALSQLLTKYLGQGSACKYIRSEILQLPVSKLCVLLDAYMEGDGYLYRDDAYQRASTVSENLALGISLVANRVGYKCAISLQSRPATCVIEGREVQQQPLWDILVHRNPKLRQKCWLEGDYQCGRVMKVSRVPFSGAVYNIEVEEDNTYVTPAMTVHNCHEHLEFYSLISLARLLGRHGLIIFDVEENAVNGGSYRLYARHRGSGVGSLGPGVYHLGRARHVAAEAEMGLHHPAAYRGLFSRMEENKSRCVDFIRSEVAAGKRVWVYGASTKGNCILQWYGLDNSLIEAAADRSPSKWGKYTVGTGIPIVSEEEFRKANPDYAIVLPYSFRDEFLRREHEWKGRGGKFIFSIPNFEVV